MDIQVTVDIKYAGDITVTVQAELSVNYPSPSFITLPMTLRFSDLDIQTKAVIAYIKGQIHVSLLESPLRHMEITSELNHSDMDTERVEAFMVQEIRKFVDTEIVFPSYYTFII